MKVCMLVLNKFTHDTRVQKEAHSLSTAELDVTVWAINDGTLPTEEHNNYTVKRWQSRLLNGRFRLPGLMYIEQYISTTIALIREKADVYHAHDANALLQSYVAAKINKAYLIYDAHELWTGLARDTWALKIKLAIWCKIEKVISPRADGVITINESISSELNQMYGINPIIIMNTHPYVEIEKSNILRQELHIDDKTNIIIYPGGFIKNRGLENLILSSSYLKDNVLVLMGPDRLNGKLQNMVQKLGMGKRVKFHAPVPSDQVLEYVASADAGVTLTLANSLNNYYSSGNKIFQFLLAGIPVAASNHPEKKRIVTTYNVGVLFDETNPQNIAETINALFSDKEQYNQMCENAREAARKELNWGIEEKKLLTLYRSL